MEDQLRKEEDSNINIREQIEQYIVHWRWFILSIAIALSIGYIYLRYTEKNYKINTTIIVKDDRRGGGNISEMMAFSDLAMFAGGNSNLENEMQLLKSNAIAEKTVRRLQLNIAYIVEGNIKKRNLYNESPFKFNFINPVFDFEKIRYSFYISRISDTDFELSDTNSKLGVFSYGEAIQTRLGTVVITKNQPKPAPTKLSDLEEPIKTNYTYDKVNVEIFPIQHIVNKYTRGLQISPTDKSSSVIDLSVIDPTPAEAIDYLNTLVDVYNEEAIADKRFVSEKTSEFISSRLKLITEELGDVEKTLEGYKNTNKLTDIPTESGIFLQNISASEKKIIENATELKVISSMIEFIQNSNSEDLLPANITSDVGSSGLINQYNNIVLERNRLKSSSTAENPAVIRLESQISSMKASIQESLVRLKSSLEIAKKDLEYKDSQLKSQLSRVPRQEREFRIIDRQQKVKEAIFLYLFQKREETAIALAATDKNAKVIDAASSSNNPVSPKKGIILLACILLGALVPFIIIYLKELLDTKVKSRLDVESATNIPFLGDVPHAKTEEKIIDYKSRSSSAEAIRIIRTNLEFMLNSVPDGQAKTIFLTSTFPKEGKTFTAVNIAASLSLSDKKVLLVGMDIRNPRLDEYLDISPIGVSNYLTDKDNTSVNEYITKAENFDNLYVLSSGTIPPNPAELLMNRRVDELFSTLKQQFDYIVVDTAPVSLVTDTLLIAKHADTFVYIARANFLDKRLLKIPDTLYKENKLPNMSFVLNDTDSTKGYGYGYGYGQNMEKDMRPWWKKLLNIN